MRTLFLLAVILLPAPALGASDWGPWEAPPKPAADKVALHEHDSSPLDWAVRFFQNYISPVDGPRCPMYPTCSAYARQALAKHGPWIGSMLTVDRLIHENDPRERQDPIKIGNRYRYYDPVSNNDFWLDSP